MDYSKLPAELDLIVSLTSRSIFCSINGNFFPPMIAKFSGNPNTSRKGKPLPHSRGMLQEPNVLSAERVVLGVHPSAKKTSNGDTYTSSSSATLVPSDSHIPSDAHTPPIACRKRQQLGTRRSSLVTDESSRFESTRREEQLLAHAKSSLYVRANMRR